MTIIKYTRPDGTITLIDDNGDTTARFTGTNAAALCDMLLNALARWTDATVIDDGAAVLVGDVGELL